ncbi:MAG: hypothetical protein AAF694_31035 [Bacteroidota bacterium]
MMDSTHKDGEFRKKFEAYLPQDVPSDLSWEQIAEPLLQGLAQEKKRRKRKRFFGIFFSIALLCIVGSLFLLWPAKSQEENSTYKDKELTSAVALEPTAQVMQDTAHANSNPISTSVDSSHLKTAKVDIPPMGAQQIISPYQVRLRTSPGDSLAKPLISLGTGTLQEHYFEGSYPLVSEIVKPTWERKYPFSRTLQPSPIKHPLQFTLYGGINKGGAMNHVLTQGSDIPQIQEDALLGWQIGALIQYPLTSTIRITTGIEVERLRYQFELEKEEETLLFRPETVDTIFVNGFTGDSTFVLTDSVPGIRSLILRHSYSSYAWKVPIWGSYHMSFEKLKLDIHGGVSLTFLQRFKGIPNAQIDRFIGESEQLIQEGMHLGLQGAIQFSYPLTGDLYLVGMTGMEKGVAEWGSSGTRRPVIYSMKIGVSKLLP